MNTISKLEQTGANNVDKENIVIVSKKRQTSTTATVRKPLSNLTDNEKISKGFAITTILADKTDIESNSSKKTRQTPKDNIPTETERTTTGTTSTKIKVFVDKRSKSKRKINTVVDNNIVQKHSKSTPSKTVFLHNDGTEISKSAPSDERSTSEDCKRLMNFENVTLRKPLVARSYSKCVDDEIFVNGEEHFIAFTTASTTLGSPVQDDPRA